MKIGTYYYPEHWPREQWERDFDRMAAMGLRIVHMGEFAWHTMEPREGVFQFDWLEKCVEMAAARKMDVILCTPTAAPPVWLCEKHPDIVPIDAAGQRMRPPGRRHYNPVAKPMQDATARIVTALAERFGRHPAVIGWQIDNEFKIFVDQSEPTHRAFQDWLRQKYETIEKLNAAWGLAFWNQQFDDFSQVKLSPTRTTTYGQPQYGNLHHVLDSSRFVSHAFAQFNKLQADILRPRIGDRFLTTNFMAFRPEVDPMEMANDLTLMSWDSYPVAGPVRRTEGDEYRIGDPATISFVHDQMASYRGRWALMELQPGQTNWGGYPVLPYPGAIRLWIWTALAHGAEFVTTYRYRQPLYGSELFHHGLVGTDGTTPSAGGRQFTQAIDELKRIDVEKWNAGADKIDPAKTIGLMLDFEQLWQFEALPQAVRWNQPKWLTTWYAAATRLGLRVRILHPKRDWPDELKLIVAAGMQMVDDGDIAQMKEYVDAGGHLVLTCRTALMDRNGHLWQDKTAAPILDLIGGEIAAYDALPEDCTGEVAMDRKRYSWSVWADLLYAEERSKVVAKYANHMYAGATAVIQCRRGKTGMATYCGVYADPPFIEALMEKLATQAELTQTPMASSRVQFIERGPYRVLLNYQDKPVSAPAPRGAKFIVGSERVEPAGVAIWEE